MIASVAVVCVKLKPTMLTWIEACAGVLVAAYFGGIVLSQATQLFDAGILNTADKNSSRRRAKFYRVFSTSWLTILGILIVSFDAKIRDSLGTIWIAAGAAAILAFLIPGPVMITADGLLRTNNFRRNSLIRWNELDHYEVNKGTQGVPDVYCFRARDGRTIKVNDWTQDAHDLLSKIHPYKPLPELPFNRR